MTQHSETAESGDDPRPSALASSNMAPRHSRLSIAGGVLALLSLVWLYVVEFLFNKLSNSAMSVGLGTFVFGWCPAIVLLCIGFVLSTIGLVLALRRRVRAMVPAFATIVCVLTFAWLFWPTTNDLVDAAMKNDTARVNRYLWLGLDINGARRTRGGFGSPHSYKEEDTPLTAAVVRGHTSMVHFLLDHGADIHRADGGGQTPVVTAVSSLRPEVLQLLLDRGARLSIKDPEKSKALLRGLGGSWGPEQQERLSQTVEILIRQGVNLEPVEIHEWAMEHWEPALARRLAEARQGRAHPVNPQTDLRNLIALGEDGRAAMLLREQTTLRTSEEWQGMRYQLLSYAARFNCPQVISVMQFHLPKPVAKLTRESPWPAGADALHQAAIVGNLEITRVLLDWGVPVDCHHEVDGTHTPLFQAVWYGHLGVARLLVERGADVNIGYRPQQRSNTPIFVAVERADRAMVEMLLDSDARVDILGHAGLTPLACAAEAGHVDLVRLLLDYGAIPGRITDSGQETLKQAGLSQQEIHELMERPVPE